MSLFFGGKLPLLARITLKNPKVSDISTCYLSSYVVCEIVFLRCVYGQ